MEYSKPRHLIKKQFSNTKTIIMNLKKSKIANIEKKRTIFFQIGLSIALAMVLAAFEWTTPAGDYDILDNGYTGSVDPYIVIPSTTHKQPKQPEPIKPYTQFEKMDDNDPFEEDPFEFSVDDVDKAYTFIDLGEEDDDDIEYIGEYSVEEKPTFNGGNISSFRGYVAKHLVFPQSAIDAGIKGQVIVAFTVDKRGNIINIELLRTVHPVLDNEVTSVISNAKGWKPGKINGHPVKVRLTMPITFDLQTK